MIHDFVSHHNLEPSFAAVKAHWDELLARLHHGRIVRNSDGRTLLAYVSDSRWVFDCPACGSADLPWQNHACCLECGRVYKVEYPADVQAGEQVLLDRPVHARNWRHGETVADLAAENERMRAVEVRPTLPDEPVRAVLLVDARFDDGQSPLLREMGRLTGFTIRWDNETGIAEVEMLGRTDQQAEVLARQLGARPKGRR